MFSLIVDIMFCLAVYFLVFAWALTTDASFGEITIVSFVVTIILAEILRLESKFK